MCIYMYICIYTLELSQEERDSALETVRGVQTLVKEKVAYVHISIYIYTYIYKYI